MAPRKTTPKKAAPVEATVIDASETTEVALVTESQQRENLSVETILMNAVDKGVSVETMERLLVMRRELKAEHAKEAFIAAMANFQSECPIITKDKKVFEKGSTTRVRYSYAPMDSIINQVREIIGKNGLSYTIDVSNENGILTAICKITHVLGHSETSSFQVPIDKDGFMSAPQKYAAASTFAKRYALMNALGILTGDEDTDASPDTVSSPAPQSYSRPAPPAQGVHDQVAPPFPSAPAPAPSMGLEDKKRTLSLQLRLLGHTMTGMTKQEANALVLKYSGLPAIVENFDEIISRLDFLLKERKEAGGTPLADEFVEFTQPDEPTIT